MAIKTRAYVSQKMDYEKNCMVYVPTKIAEAYMKYCEANGFDCFEKLKIMVLEEKDRLYKQEEMPRLYDLIVNRDGDREYIGFRIKLPNEELNQINTYCKMLRIFRQRGILLFYLVEERLRSMITLEDQKNESVSSI